MKLPRDLLVSQRSVAIMLTILVTAFGSAVFAASSERAGETVTQNPQSQTAKTAASTPPEPSREDVEATAAAGVTYFNVPSQFRSTKKTTTPVSAPAASATAPTAPIDPEAIYVQPGGASQSLAASSQNDEPMRWYPPTASSWNESPPPETPGAAVYVVLDYPESFRDYELSSIDFHVRAQAGAAKGTYYLSFTATDVNGQSYAHTIKIIVN